MKTVWTNKDIGCHIDGAFGQSHCLDRLGNLVFGTGTRSDDWTAGYECGITHRRILDALADGPSDDGNEFTDATEYLQSHTADGLVWQWVAGDLILMAENDVELNEHGYEIGSDEERDAKSYRR